MKFYHEASKIVKPKLGRWPSPRRRWRRANKALSAAEDRLKACKDRLAQLQDMFDNQMAEKKRIEDGALALQRKMNQASELIGGLAGERERWTDDANNFADLKRRLVGDCAVGCAFISYCGPFNQEYRASMVNEKFIVDLKQKEVPVTSNLDVINFLVDVGTIGDWNMEGLPTDPLSIQNGILVTRSSRYPLLIDPQGQALSWIKSREAERMPNYGPVALNDSKLRDKLEFCMGDGRSMMIIGVEEEIDPMLDPLLEKEFIIKGSRISIVISDKNMDFDSNFKVFFITRLPNPNFSPELQAKVTVVDFTVTQKGLEEQLLGKVIGKEQKALEEQLSQVLEDVNSNTKALLALDASLLERLTSNTGNLLEDEELIGVLANTKAKAAEVNTKLKAAAETKESINEKREQFRPVATRGSVLYFSIVESSYMNCMYQTSLDQFLLLFMDSMDQAEKATLASKRVANIIETMTYITYRYVNRGLYEKDKLTYVLLLTLKVLVTAGLLKQSDVTLFLRGGAALDIAQERRKPNWIDNDPWLNVIELSRGCKFFANLPTDITANEAMWRRWYDDNEPENMAIPDYENKLNELSADIGPFYRLLLVRSLRVDRCILQCKEFIRACQQMGPTYVEPVTDTIDEIYSEMVPEVPVIFLLSVGADPTESIEQLARKRKLPPPATISLGEGQEPVAIKAMNAAAANGTWVLLQNCELGLGLMDMMEDLMAKLMESVDPGFRLFITALPNDQFPLGLLQMSTKVTNEPPAGLKAGLLRSYTVIVDQERLERVETAQWRQLVFGLCFLHSVVQERRSSCPRLVHPLRVQHGRPDRLHPLPGEAPVQRPHLLAHLPVHGGRGPVRRENHRRPGPAHVQDVHRGVAHGQRLLRVLQLQPVLAHLPHPQRLCVPDPAVRAARGLPHVPLVLPGDRLPGDLRAAPERGPDLPQEGGELAVRHAGRDAAQGRRRRRRREPRGRGQPEVRGAGGAAAGGLQRGRLQGQDQQAGRPGGAAEHLPLPGDPAAAAGHRQGALHPGAAAAGDQRRGGDDRGTAGVAGLHVRRPRAPLLDLHRGRRRILLDPARAGRLVLLAAGPRQAGPRGWRAAAQLSTGSRASSTRRACSRHEAGDDAQEQGQQVGAGRRDLPHGGHAVHARGAGARAAAENGVVHGCTWAAPGASRRAPSWRARPRPFSSTCPCSGSRPTPSPSRTRPTKRCLGSIAGYRRPATKYPSRTDRYLIFMVNLKRTTERNPKYWILRGVALLCNTD
ncbi:unnamed protein product [Heterosigma akashiwo]